MCFCVVWSTIITVPVLPAYTASHPSWWSSVTTIFLISQNWSNQCIHICVNTSTAVTHKKWWTSLVNKKHYAWEAQFYTCAQDITCKQNTHTQNSTVWAMVNAWNVRRVCKLVANISINFCWYYYYLENLFEGNTRYLNTCYSQYICKWSTFSSKNWVCKLLAPWRSGNKTCHEAE